MTIHLYYRICKYFHLYFMYCISLVNLEWKINKFPVQSTKYTLTIIFKIFRHETPFLYRDFACIFFIQINRIYKLSDNNRLRAYRLKLKIFERFGPFKLFAANWILCVKVSLNWEMIICVRLLVARVDEPNLFFYTLS